MYVCMHVCMYWITIIILLRQLSWCRNMLITYKYTLLTYCDTMTMFTIFHHTWQCLILNNNFIILHAFHMCVGHFQIQQKDQSGSRAGFYWYNLKICRHTCTAVLIAICFARDPLQGQFDPPCLHPTDTIIAT